MAPEADNDPVARSSPTSDRSVQKAGSGAMEAVQALSTPPERAPARHASEFSRGEPTRRASDPDRGDTGRGPPAGGDLDEAK